MKKVNVLREALFDGARSQDINILFYRIDEIRKKQIDPKTCSQREIEYHTFDHFSFPSELASFCVQKQPEALLCLSKGEAEGILVRLDEMDQAPSLKILYTETLTPDLVHLFPKIQGILTRRGGVLSHLAILAREHGIPVLSNVDLHKQRIGLGERIKMNADEASITRLE